MSTARLSQAGDPMTFADMLRFTFAWILLLAVGSVFLADAWLRLVAR